MGAGSTDRSLGCSAGPRAGFLPQLTRRFFHPGALTSHGQTQLRPHFPVRGPVWSPEAEPPQGTNRQLSCHSPRTNPTGTVTPLTRTHHVGAGTHAAVCTHARSHTHPTRAYTLRCTHALPPAFCPLSVSLAWLPFGPFPIRPGRGDTLCVLPSRSISSAHRLSLEKWARPPTVCTQLSSHVCGPQTVSSSHAGYG